LNTFFQKFQKYIFETCVLVSILSGSIEIFGITAVDEFLYLVLALFCITTFRLRDRLGSKSSTLGTLLLLYLLISTVIKMLISPSHSTLRFTLILASYVVLREYILRKPQDSKNLKRFNIFGYSMYLYSWLFYGVLLSLLGIDWNEKQANWWAGSAYAAIIPSLGIYVMAFYFLQDKSKSTKYFWTNFAFTFVAAYLFDSRVLYFSAISLILLILILNFSFRTLSKILIVAFLTFSVTSVMSYNGINNGSGPREWYSSQTLNTQKNLQLITNPRDSDEDRSWQINCAVKLVLNLQDNRILESNSHTVIQSIFGYGQNNHKRVLLRCFGMEPKSSSGDVRTVGFAAYLLDFGILGFALLALLILQQGISLVRFGNKNSWILLACFGQLLSFALITNYLDHSILFLGLFTTYFYSMQLKSNDANKLLKSNRP
jgi:hypothetical protein